MRRNWDNYPRMKTNHPYLTSISFQFDTPQNEKRERNLQRRKRSLLTPLMRTAEQEEDLYIREVQKRNKKNGEGQGGYRDLSHNSSLLTHQTYESYAQSTIISCVECCGF